MNKDIKDLKVLISEEQLQKRIKEVADEINSAYGTEDELTLICVLKGALMFFTELSRYLKMPVKMEFVSLSSYGNSQKSSGKITALNLSLPQIEEKRVLVVEDIVDTGLTLDFLINFLKTKCGVEDVKLCALFDKKCARKYSVYPDFTAFEIDDKFIIGFGLDYNELYRNLPYVGYFEA